MISGREQKRDKRQKAGEKSTPEVRNGRRGVMGQHAEKMGRSSYRTKTGECVYDKETEKQ